MSRLTDQEILDCHAQQSGRPVTMGRERILAQARALEALIAKKAADSKGSNSGAAVVIGPDEKLPVTVRVGKATFEAGIKLTVLVKHLVRCGSYSQELRDQISAHSVKPGAPDKDPTLFTLLSSASEKDQTHD